MGFEKKKFQSESLFDIASKRYSHEKEHVQRAEHKEEVGNSDDLQAVWLKLKEKYEELELRLENLFKFSQVTPQALSKFLSNPKNFSQEDWLKIQNEREANKKKMEELCRALPSGGEDAFQRYLQAVSLSTSQEEAQEVTQPNVSSLPKKKKMLSRRRWLNMH